MKLHLFELLRLDTREVSHIRWSPIHRGVDGKTKKDPQNITCIKKGDRLNQINAADLQNMWGNRGPGGKCARSKSDWMRGRKCIHLQGSK